MQETRRWRCGLVSIVTFIKKSRMMIPDEILHGDCNCILMDWGVAATAEVVTLVGEPPEESVAATSVMVIVGPMSRTPHEAPDADMIELTLTAATDSLPTIPDSATLRWQYDGHQWNVRETHTLAGEMMTVFAVRRAD